MTRHVEKIRGISLQRSLAVAALALLLTLTLTLTLGAAKSEVSDAGKRASEESKQIIGATAELVEADCGFAFQARIDTGAKSCSLHVDAWEVKDAAKFKSERKTMKANIGKTIRFRLVNGEGKSQWVEKKIVGYAIYKTSEKKERRYQVVLDLNYNGFKKLVKVNLNDRSHMEFPLLIGRNYLRGDFLVDVDLDNDEKAPSALKKEKSANAEGVSQEKSDVTEESVEEETDDDQEVQEDESE